MKIISSAPTRISLFGGGTDVDPYTTLYGGICVNIAINIRQTIILTNKEHTINSKNIVPQDGNLNFLKKILKQFNCENLYSIGNRGIRLQSFFDGCIGAGLGSSAACAIALIGAINKLRNTQFTSHEIAHIAWDIETNKMNKHGGKQDHYAAVYGGCNIFLFSKNKVIRKKIALSEKISDGLVLFYIGGKRESNEIQNNFKNLTSDKIQILDQMKEIAVQGIIAIKMGKIKRVAELLKKSFELKKKSNTVTNERLDTAYRIGIENGALAGKILGAGQGGYMLFIVPPTLKQEFIEKMKKRYIKHIDYSICYNGLETRIVEE